MESSTQVCQNFVDKATYGKFYTGNFIKEHRGSNLHVFLLEVGENLRKYGSKLRSEYRPKLIESGYS